MNFSKDIYRKYADAHAPSSPLLADCVRAFLVGGSVCAFAQLIRTLYIYLGIDGETAATLTSVTLIAITALLTGLGIFDKIAKFAGAGTLVPITGFANAVASPAIDSRSEGYILGVGSKIFTVAGPVLLYGILSGALCGVIYFLVGLIF